MRLIIKSEEPKSLATYRNSKIGNFGAFQEKEELRDYLLKEQQFLCAYCMNSIENHPSLTKIEHYKPRSKYPNLQLTYNNLHVVCIGKNDNFTHCDTTKDNEEIIISPLMKNDIDKIKYIKSNNSIVISSEDQTHNEDLISIKKLNLNSHFIAKNRYTALKTFQLQIQNKYFNKKANLHKEIENLKNNNRLPPYFGVIEFFYYK